MERTLLKNSLVYSVTTFLQKGLVFLLLPLYIKYLPPSEYGIVTVILAISFVSTALFTLGLDSAIIRFYYDSKSQEQEFKKLFGTLLLSLLVVSFFVFTLAVSLFFPVVQYLIGSIPFYPFAYLGFGIVVFLPTYNLCLAFLQAKHQALTYSILSFTYFAVNVGLTIVLVIVLRWGASGYLMAILLAQAISVSLGLFILRNEIAWSFRWSYLKKAFTYSMPLIPHSMASQAAGYADRIIINKFLDTSRAGIYHLGYVLSMPIEILTFSFNRAYTPIFFEHLKEKKDTSEIIEMGLLISLVYLFFCTALSQFSHEVVTWFFDPAFAAAVYVIPFVGFSFLNTGLYYLFSTILFYEKNLTKYVPISTIIAGILTLMLDLFLIPRMGLLGAGISIYTGQLTLAILTYIFSYRQIVTWPILKMITCYVSGVIVSVMGILLTVEIDNAMIVIPVKLLLLLLLLLLWSKVYFNNAFRIFHQVRAFLVKVNVLK